MVEPESGNIATNELTSPKTLGTGSNSSMGKSAGKWASTPPLLPIKSYAAVEPELMKEIEKLQHRRTRLFLPPLRHRLAFPLIDFFFPSSLLQPPSPSPNVSLLPPPPFPSPDVYRPLSARAETPPEPSSPEQGGKSLGGDEIEKSVSGVDCNSSR